MEKLNPIQLKSLSEFANTVAAAWFTAGIISPFFAKQASFFELVKFPLAGIAMTAVTLRWSLSLLEGVKS